MPTTQQRPLQRSFKMKLEVEVPLLTVDGARAVLQLDGDEVLELIADRKLAWAFNIGNAECGARSAESDRNGRREVRILTRCVLGYQTTSVDCGLASRSIEEIAGWILAREVDNNRKPKEFIMGSRLKDLFLCSSELVIDLCRAGELEVIPGTEWRRGRDGTPVISRESIIHFLKERRM